MNVYWRGASDDVTRQDALEYQVTCSPDGGTAEIVLDWTPSTSSSRYYTQVCAGSAGSYDAWVSVRDEAGNVTDLPKLTGAIP